MNAGLFRNAEAKTFQPGQIIFKEGDVGDAMYVVNEGEVELQIGPHKEIVEPGSIFGEMSLIDDGVRSASAVAKSECKLVPIDRRRFQFLVQETPYFALEVMKVMADRLRRSNARAALPVGHAAAGDGK